MRRSCSCLDCCQDCLSVSTAPLFLVRSTILRYLSFGKALNTLAIASSSLEYRFCFALVLSVKEKVSSLRSLYADVDISIAPLILTTLFRAKLFTAIRTAKTKSACLTADSTTIVCIRFSYGASVKGLIVSRFSIGNSLSVSIT